MGTMLMSSGLGLGEAPEGWNFSHPAQVRAIHRNYIQAGSNIILTNSLGGTRFRFKLHGLQASVTELNRVAAELARVEADGALSPVTVGGSIGPTGELFEPMGVLAFGEARDAFAEQAAALVEGGVDLFWIETMSDLQELQAAVMAVRAISDLPIVTAMTFDTHGCTIVIFRAILTQVFSPIGAQWFSSKLAHLFSPKRAQCFSPRMAHLFSPMVAHSKSPPLGGDGAGEIPSRQAYSQLSNQREREGTCLKRGKIPWTFEKS